MLEQSKLPELISSSVSSNRSAEAYYPPILPAHEFEAGSPPVPLSHYFWILRRNLWKMVAFIATCVLATAIVSARMKPIYESTATVVVDRQAPSEVVGQDSTRPASNDTDAFLATQIKLIQSDSVLRPVVEQYNLLNTGGESKTNQANPQRMQDAAAAPVSLGSLKVTRPVGTYLLLISYRSSDPRLAANVSNAITNSYLAQTYNLRIRSSASLSSFMEKQLDELKAKMEQSGMALAQFEKDLDVINPEEKTNILSARLLQLNTEYATAQGDRVRSEAAWNAIKSGSVEAAQVSSQGESLAKLTDSLNQARQQFAQVKSTYGTTHPEYRKAASELAEVEKQFEDTRRSIGDRIFVQYNESLNREQMLQKAVTETKAEWDQINARSFEYQRLKQEADTDKALYDELIKKIREADINVGFQNNNIRIADLARPTLRPVFPNSQLNLTLAFLFSTLLAIGAALLQDTLDTTLRSPEEASRFLGVDVIGSLPIDRSSSHIPKVVTPGEAAMATAALTNRNGNGTRRKGYYSSISTFEEAVRTVRTTILLADFEQRLRSIVVTSAVPSEGKTTMTFHLALASAAHGKKTLLVDGDLRRPSLHAKFGLSPDQGLSNVLNGEMAWQDVVIPIEGRPDLSMLPAGPGSHRAADLIGPRLATLLDEFAKNYDLVILDSPPLLGFAECLQMASAADGVLIISRAGETRRKAVAEVISVLRRVRANLIGVVLNQVSQNTSSDGYSYYGYYSYGHYQKAE